MLVVGVDIGLKGAIAVMDNDRAIRAVADAPIIRGGKNKRDLMDIDGMVEVLSGYADADLIVLEQSSTRPHQSAQSGLKTGFGAGLWVGACSALRATYVSVRPQQWQRSVLAGQPGEGKERAIGYVQRRWPSAPIYGPRGAVKDGRCDAICIAEYGILTLEGQS
jgi:hypothetical protein